MKIIHKYCVLSVLFVLIGVKDIGSNSKKLFTKIALLNKDNLFKTPKDDFHLFKEALAFKESQGKYDTISKYGYLGKYQFGVNTLKRFKIYDSKKFLNNPKLQEKAFLALCSVNKWILRRDIKRFVGKTINGIEITESGILAAAHLSGAGNVKKYLRSNGGNNVRDAFGSSLQYYLRKFSGYNVSSIPKDKSPIVSV